MKDSELLARLKPCCDRMVGVRLDG